MGVPGEAFSVRDLAAIHFAAALLVAKPDLLHLHDERNTLALAAADSFVRLRGS